MILCGLNTLKGIWIPKDILTIEKLSDKEKYIYSLILFFSKNDGYCIITNKYIANIINLSDTRVSRLISSLAKKEYLKIKAESNISGDNTQKRKIIPLIKYDYIQAYSKTTTPIVENDNTYCQNSTNTIVKNDNTSCQKSTTAIVESDKYKNNNKNYKNIKNNIYSISGKRNYDSSFFKRLYANGEYILD